MAGVSERGESLSNRSFAALYKSALWASGVVDAAAHRRSSVSGGGTTEAQRQNNGPKAKEIHLTHLVASLCLCVSVVVIPGEKLAG